MVLKGSNRSDLCAAQRCKVIVERVRWICQGRCAFAYCELSRKNN